MVEREPNSLALLSLEKEMSASDYDWVRVMLGASVTQGGGEVKAPGLQATGSHEWHDADKDRSSNLDPWGSREHQHQGPGRRTVSLKGADSAGGVVQRQSLGSMCVTLGLSPNTAEQILQP